ncbi:D-glycero-beta-D-manno-heptose 1,7-bisphosphate 7-phosphatase [Methanospirillum sp.]
MIKAIFLDRDGVITADPPHHAHRIDQLSLIPGSAEAIRLLNRHGFTVIVITNQSGVAKGMYTEKDIHIFNTEMQKRLMELGAYVDAIYYCPHHPEGIVPEYRKDCDCRKPKPGMLRKALNDMKLTLDGSFLVGDKWSDIRAGKSVGCTTILVMTGHGQDEYTEMKGSSNYYADDLLSAVKNIIIPGIHENLP